MNLVDLIVALVIAIGLVGIIVPLLPGSVLIMLAVLGWAIHGGEGGHWVVFAVAVALLATGTLVKYLVPGRSMKRSGVPNSTLFAGAGLGVVGFFVIPVVGLVVGFVLGVYLAELKRVGDQAARGTTIAALRAAGVSILIELGFALLAGVTWAVGAVVL